MKKTLIKSLISAMLICALPATADAYINRDTAIVRVMNKAAGKTYTLEIPTGDSANFEKLTVTVRACKQTDPFDAEDYFAFIEAATLNDGLVFSNWMSRNEPGLNPLQHADYDLWLVKCENKE